MMFAMREIRTTLFVTMTLASVTAYGCGVAAKVHARDDMMHAKSAYTQCLTENSSDPSKCAGLKEAYDADLQAYRATSSGLRSGSVLEVQSSE
jgi:hypothetical protein